MLWKAPCSFINLYVNISINFLFVIIDFWTVFLYVFLFVRYYKACSARRKVFFLSFFFIREMEVPKRKIVIRGVIWRLKVKVAQFKPLHTFFVGDKNQCKCMQKVFRRTVSAIFFRKGSIRPTTSATTEVLATTFTVLSNNVRSKCRVSHTMWSFHHNLIAYSLHWIFN